MFFEHKLLYPVKGEVPEGEYVVPLGRAEVKREGSDVTVVATSIMVQKALEAADKLAAEDISLEVVDPRSLVPLDEETILASVEKTGRVVIAQEAATRSGFSAEIAAVIAEKALDYLDAPLKRVGSKPAPIPFAGVLEQFILPDTDDIIAAVRELA